MNKTGQPCVTRKQLLRKDNKGMIQQKGSESILMKRLWYLLLTIIWILIEVLIAKFVHDEFVRPYFGDVLVVFAVYTFVRIFFPQGIKFLPLYVFLFALLIEILQWFHIVDLLGLLDNRFLRTLIGGVFDWKDILCYGIGCLILGIIGWNGKKRVKRHLIIVAILPLLCLVWLCSIHIDFTIDAGGDFWVKYNGKKYWEDYSLESELHGNGKVLARKPGLKLLEIENDPDHHYLGAHEGGLFGMSHMMAEPGYCSGEIPGDFCTAYLDHIEIHQKDTIQYLNDITNSANDKIVIDYINPISQSEKICELRVGFDPDAEYGAKYPWGFFDDMDGDLVYCFEVQDFHQSKLSDNFNMTFPYKAVVIDKNLLPEELRIILGD